MNRKEQLLTILIEECGEVIQAATKALRFGLDDYYKQPPDNKEKISAEMADVMGTFFLLIKEGILDAPEQSLILGREKRIENYLLYSKEKGTLID